MVPGPEGSSPYAIEVVNGIAYFWVRLVGVALGRHRGRHARAGDFSARPAADGKATRRADPLLFQPLGDGVASRLSQHELWSRRRRSGVRKLDALRRQDGQLTLRGRPAARSSPGELRLLYRSDGTRAGTTVPVGDPVRAGSSPGGYAFFYGRVRGYAASVYAG